MQANIIKHMSLTLQKTNKNTSWESDSINSVMKP